MPQKSAGVLLFRRKVAHVQFFLVHSGGPFWAKKDDGAWSIPKGLIDEGEDAQAAARREFEEETGVKLEGSMTELGAFRQPSGKIVQAWALERDVDPATITSNTFEMEWPPKSGRTAKFSEVDRAAWFDRTQAMIKITRGQRPIIDVVCRKLGIYD